MSIVECKKTISHREFRTWQQYFADEMNRPSRTDFYLMKLMAYQLSKPPKHLNELAIKFDDGAARKSRLPRVSREVATAWAKAKWLSFLGVIGPKRPKDL